MLSLLSLLAQIATPGLRVTLPVTPDQSEKPPVAARQSKPSGTSGERPEELVPEIVQFLKEHPEIRAVPKVVQVGFLPDMLPRCPLVNLADSLNLDCVCNEMSGVIGAAIIAHTQHLKKVAFRVC